MAVPYAPPTRRRLNVARGTSDPALVARRPVHSVAVPLHIYGKVVDSTDRESLDHIWSATRRPPCKARFQGTPSGRNSRTTPDTASYSRAADSSGEWANGLVRDRSPWCGMYWVRTNVGDNHHSLGS